MVPSRKLLVDGFTPGEGFGVGSEEVKGTNGNILNSWFIMVKQILIKGSIRSLWQEPGPSNHS